MILNDIILSTMSQVLKYGKINISKDKNSQNMIMEKNLKLLKKPFMYILRGFISQHSKSKTA